MTPQGVGLNLNEQGKEFVFPAFKEQFPALGSENRTRI